MVPLRILLIDDDESILEMLKTFLAINGHECVPTNSLWKALSLLDTEAFDIILLDLALSGTSGLSAIADIKLKSAARIIIMTGDSNPETRIDALRLGARNFLTKPIDLPDLERCLEAAAKIEN